MTYARPHSSQVGRAGIVAYACLTPISMTGPHAALEIICVWRQSPYLITPEENHCWGLASSLVHILWIENWGFGKH